MDDLSSVFIIYLLLVLVWLIVAVFPLVPIMKRQDVTILAKLFWCAVIVLIPLAGLVIYLVYNYYREKHV